MFNLHINTNNVNKNTELIITHIHSFVFRFNQKQFTTATTPFLNPRQSNVMHIFWIYAAPEIIYTYVVYLLLRIIIILYSNVTLLLRMIFIF